MTQTTTKTSLLAVLVAAQACNPSSSIEDEIDLGETEQAVYDPANPPAPVATNDCDDPTHAATPYSSTSSGHFVAYYIPGTAAESDLAGILAAREAAYTDITTALGITTEPTIRWPRRRPGPQPRLPAIRTRERGVRRGFTGTVCPSIPDAARKMTPARLCRRVWADVPPPSTPKASCARADQRGMTQTTTKTSLLAVLVAAQDRGIRSLHTLSLEKFPEGWRVTYDPTGGSGHRRHKVSAGRRRPSGTGGAHRGPLRPFRRPDLAIAGCGPHDQKASRARADQRGMTQTTTKTSLLAVLVAAQACNPSSSIEDEIDLGETEQAVYDPANPPAPVATNDCDDPTHAATPYSSTSSGHFVAYYIPGTAAESDLAGILAAREAAYTDITTALGITTEPTISLYLSPSRAAAQAHSRGYGNAYPGQDRYEVVYNGATGSFETTRVGNLLARTLEYHIDTANPKRIPILSVGLAEVLDQSGRDLHDAYALQLHANVETRVRVSSFDSADLSGKNVGRAASLARFLIDRYGMAAFLDLFKATAVTSVAGCSMKSATYGCINSAAALTAMLDGVISAETGDSWSTVAADWQAEVDSRIATVKVNLGPADKNAISNLVNLMDQAIETGDPAIYRSTMEGFYCEWLGEAGRDEIAARTVQTLEAFGSRSTVLRIIPTAAANFPAARALVMRLDDRGIRSLHTLSLEKFPEGWRVTYGPDWW